MRISFSGHRRLAAAVACIGFVATFAVSARAVIQDEPDAPIYTIVSVDRPDSTYRVGQDVVVTTPVANADVVEIAEGVWAQRKDTSS